MRAKQKGFSLIELLIVVAIILIIAAIAIPNLLRARIAANEASAVSSLRTMNTADITYNSTYGSYSPDLSSMGPSNGATPTSTTADLLDQVLAPAGGLSTSTKSGYTFTYATASGGYNINAAPVSLNQTGVPLLLHRPVRSASLQRGSCGNFRQQPAEQLKELPPVVNLSQWAAAKPPAHLFFVCAFCARKIRCRTKSCHPAIAQSANADEVQLLAAVVR